MNLYAEIAIEEIVTLRSAIVIAYIYQPDGQVTERPDFR
jgi:hypothetical protein